MTQGTPDIEALIELMARLPGLGPRSARRAVLHLIKKRTVQLLPLAEALHKVGTTARAFAGGRADLVKRFGQRQQLHGALFDEV